MDTKTKNILIGVGVAIAVIVIILLIIFGVKAASNNNNPAAPSSLAISTVGSNYISLQWKTVANASYYGVARKEENQDFDYEYAMGIQTSGTIVVWTDYNIQYNTTYQYQVFAYNDPAQKSELSNAVVVTTKYEPTEKPNPVQVSLVGSTTNSVTLQWNTVANALYYRVSRTSPDQQYPMERSGITAENANDAYVIWTDTTTDINTYQYIVYAYNNLAPQSDPSNMLTVNTLLPPYVNVNSLSYNSVTLLLSSTNTDSTYFYEIYQQGNQNLIAYIANSSNPLFYTIESLESDTQYTWNVRLHAPNGVYSNFTSITAKTAARAETPDVFSDTFQAYQILDYSSKEMETTQTPIIAGIKTTRNNASSYTSRILAKNTTSSEGGVEIIISNPDTTHYNYQSLYFESSGLKNAKIGSVFYELNPNVGFFYNLSDVNAFVMGPISIILSQAGNNSTNSQVAMQLALTNVDGREEIFDATPLTMGQNARFAISGVDSNFLSKIILIELRYIESPVDTNKNSFNYMRISGPLHVE